MESLLLNLRSFATRNFGFGFESSRYTKPQAVDNISFGSVFSYGVSCCTSWWCFTWLYGFEGWTSDLISLPSDYIPFPNCGLILQCDLLAQINRATLSIVLELLISVI